MPFIKTYQVADSSIVKTPFVIEESDELNNLELIEEVDEPIELPKQKKEYFSKIKLDTAEQTDTFYGINNEKSIPIRQTEQTTTETHTLEKLFDPNPKAINIANWQVIILVLIVVLLGFAKAFSSNRFKQSIKALFNYGTAQEISREEKVFFHRSNLLFTAIHLLATSLFLYHLKELFNSGGLVANKFMFFLLIFGGLTILYTFKYLFFRILSFIFNEASIASEYIFNVSLYNNLLGVILIPILCIMFFSSLPILSVLFYVAFPLIFLIFLLRVIRLYLVGIRKGILYSYIFLYICSLEILPLVVFYRIFVLK